MNKRYYVELQPDARGFRTFLDVKTKNGNIIEAILDGRNYDDNPYGEYKSTSEKYNEDMYNESGIKYSDAKAKLENQILEGKDTLERVKGARFLSQDANELLEKVKNMMEKSKNMTTKDN